MKLAIITCNKLPNGVSEDLPLFNALKEQSINIDIVAWNREIDWPQYDACLLRSVWDYHENIDQFMQWLQTTSQITPIFNTWDIVLWNQNKTYLAELEKFGITIAPTKWLTNQQPFDLNQWLSSQTQNQFFLKPVIGADSSGTFRFNKNSDIELAKAHLRQWLPKVDMMLQPYLNSVETFGETSAIYFNDNFSHAVRKIPVNGDYRVQDTFGAQDVSYQLNAAEMALSDACLDYLYSKFGNILYARFDFLHDKDGNIYLNEAELIEPSLFFNHDHNAAVKFAKAIKQKIENL